MKRCLVMVLLTSAMWGQIGQKSEIAEAKAAIASMPSDPEVSEHLDKATQKVAEFRKAVNLAKPFLDQSDPQLAKNYLDAAATADLIIGTMKKSGFSAYGLTSLLSTLDDLSLDGAVGSVYLLRNDAEKLSRGEQPGVGMLTGVVSLTTAGNACYDISELIMHATLRYIAAEEKILAAISPTSSPH